MAQSHYCWLNHFHFSVKVRKYCLMNIFLKYLEESVIQPGDQTMFFPLRICSSTNNNRNLILLEHHAHWLLDDPEAHFEDE